MKMSAVALAAVSVHAGLGLAAVGAAQEKTPAATPPAREVVQTPAELVEHLGEQGVEVDLEAGTITIETVRNEPTDPLEYLLIHRRGKSHEALLVTEVKPSVLNSAFLLLGFEKGRNVRYEPIDPPPTEAEVRAGADWVTVFPPEGPALYMTATWTEDEVDHTAAVSDLIIDLRTGEPVEDNSWVYLGGRMAALYRGEPPVFVGDFEGNLVSICYLSPENHLGTMVHERARSDQNWWIADLCPEAGTPVTLRFHRDKPPAVVARAKRLAAPDDDGK